MGDIEALQDAEARAEARAARGGRFAWLHIWWAADCRRGWQQMVLRGNRTLADDVARWAALPVRDVDRD